MATRIHPKNVHEKSPKNVHEMSPKKRSSRGQKCPRNVIKSVHEMSPNMSTRCLPPSTLCSLLGHFIANKLTSISQPTEFEETLTALRAAILFS